MKSDQGGEKKEKKNEGRTGIYENKAKTYNQKGKERTERKEVKMTFSISFIKIRHIPRRRC